MAGLNLCREPSVESSRLCLCNSPLHASQSSRVCSQEQAGSEGFWRPWIPTPKDVGRQLTQIHTALCSSSETTEDSAKLTWYTHPVRLFWPKSRCFDYLYQEAEALLRNFPVQATISFYEDSENEEENDDLDHESEELDSEEA